MQQIVHDNQCQPHNLKNIFISKLTENFKYNKS